MKRRLFLALTVALLALGIVSMPMAGAHFEAGTDLDVATGLPYIRSAQPELNAISMAPTAGNIIWDLTHGLYLDYEPAGRYTTLVSLLAGLGFSVDTTTAGLDNIDLSPYSVIVVHWAGAWDTAYTASEVAAIDAFVQAGGGLIIHGDNTSTHNEHINPVANVYGTTCAVSELQPGDLYLTDLSAHPIFAGVSQVYYRAAGEITASAPAEMVARADDGKGAAAVAQAGLGRVVILGDGNLWDNAYIANADNQLFAENVFNWLSESTCPVTLTLQDEAVFSNEADASHVAATLYDLRAGLLSNTVAGQHYRSLFEQHAGRITGLLLRDPALRSQFGDFLLELTPVIEDLIAGSGQDVVISSNLVKSSEAFLDRLAQADGGALAKTIRVERARVQWQNLSGLTTAEAWNSLAGQVAQTLD